ncbi:MAG: acyl-ACP--UDP-N-acetylglucosamine O-acyltransferase [Acidobacteria bacterium]|nr:acyl-ACP--UDP-N-acetylglucosamine O-acyltransferase [Acidobacteriota bacterium]
MSEIDARAVVSPRARLGQNVKIEAFALVGDDVTLGGDCVVHSHAVLRGPARIGARNVFHSFCAIGGDPQDLTYKGERTELEIGDANVFHEYVTVNRGTVKGGGVTRLGHRNLLMAYSHVAHDCQVGSDTVFANGATLAGHVIVEDWASVGAFCPVHQFCRIGQHSYIAAFTVITQDIVPFAKVVAPRETKTYGANTIGLERRGFSKERVAAIEQAFRLLLRGKMNTTQAVEKMKETLAGQPDVEEIVRFIESAERGICK